MSMMVSPPERRMMECPDCEGSGLVSFDNRETGECEECFGSGEVRFDPDSNPYAPDTWKEAEGIA